MKLISTFQKLNIIARFTALESDVKKIWGEIATLRQTVKRLQGNHFAHLEEDVKKQGEDAYGLALQVSRIVAALKEKGIEVRIDDAEGNGY